MIDYVFTIVWGAMLVASIVLAVKVENFYTVVLPVSCVAGLAASFVGMDSLAMKLFVQVLAAVVVYAFILVPYKLVSKLNPNKIRRGRTNLQALIGERCMVVEDISNINVKGLVNLKGSIWSARSVDQNDYIEQGTIVVVTSVEGVKLVCKREK